MIPRPAFLVLAASAALPAASAAALPPRAAVQVRDAEVRAPPPGAATASAHLVVLDTGRTADQLQAVSSPDAASAEVHAMDMAGGVMRMRPTGPLPVPAGGRLDLSAASGRHLMLTGLRRPLHAGDRVHLVLRFAHAGAVGVDAPVVGARR